MRKTATSILLNIILLMVFSSAMGQYISRNNNTGEWDDVTTWTGGNFENDPVNGDYVAIEGLVKWYPSGGDSTLNFNLGGNPPGNGDSALVVRDTLVIYGNLNFANKNNLYIEDGGMLIVYGDLSGDNKIALDPQGYLIIEGDLNFNNQNAGDITNGDNMYLGGNSTNCADTECTNINNDSTDLTSDSLDVFDFYNGENPDNSGSFSINPFSTDICSRTSPRVTLYFSDDDNDAVDEYFWQTSADGVSFSDSAGTNGESNLVITSSKTRYFRVRYSTDGGNSFVSSDTAVVYCNTLCTLNASVSFVSGTSEFCYSSGIQVDLTSSATNGTTPYSYTWSISPSVNSEGTALSENEAGDQVSYSDFTNPATTSDNYTVTLEVSDSEGCSDTVMDTLTLYRRPETGSSYYVPSEFGK